MSEPIVTLLLQAAVVVLPLGLGIIAGTMLARSHLRQLGESEAELAGIVASDLAASPLPLDPGVTGRLVLGQVALGCDHFRSMIAALVSIFGGEIRVYSRLLERARREALVRLKREARIRGCDLVLNVRFDTSSIGFGANIVVEVLASGTAVRSART